MDQRVRFRAAHRRAARPAHPSRPYPADEWRQLQAQSEQAPLTPFQLGHADGSSQPSLMPDEKLISSVGFLPTSLMYFCSGEPMHFCSGVDTSGAPLSRREIRLAGLFALVWFAMDSFWFISTPNHWF